MKLLPATSCYRPGFDAGGSCDTVFYCRDAEPGGHSFKRNDDFEAMMRNSQTAAYGQRSSAGFVLRVGMVVICTSWFGASSAQKLVDPNSVAPEYREAAEKRRAEQLKLLQCSKKADEAKVPRRDRAAHISACLDK